MSAEVKLGTRHAFRVLRPGPFRRYIIGSAISDTGTWMQVMTQGWVMATLTTSAFMLGLVSLCAGLPTLSALVPELVKREEIQAAISLDRSVFHGSRVVGPAIGGVLASAWGYAS